DQEEKKARDGDARIIDRKRNGDTPGLPGPGEPVRPLVAISGDTFSFVRSGKVDVARLAGVEAPGREDEAAANKARDRMEELLSGAEVTFELPEAKGTSLVVYARAKKPETGEVSLAETLLKEGLVRAKGEHPRREAFEKLEAEARSAKRGLFAK